MRVRLLLLLVAAAAAVLVAASSSAHATAHGRNDLVDVERERLQPDAERHQPRNWRHRQRHGFGFGVGRTTTTTTTNNNNVHDNKDDSKDDSKHPTSIEWQQGGPAEHGGGAVTGGGIFGHLAEMVGFQQATQVMFSLKSFGRCIYAANRMFEGDVTFSSSPSFEHSDMSQPSSSGVPSQSYHRVVFGHWTSPLALRACHISFSRLVESVQATHNLLQEIPEYQERVPEEIRAYFAASVPALSVQTCLHNWTSELQLAQCVDTVAASDARLHAVIRNSVSARFESVTPGTRQSAFRVAYTAAELRTCLASSPGLIEAVGPSEAIGVQTVVRALFTLIKRRFHYAMLVSHVFGSDDDETAAAGDADAAAPRHPNAAAAPHHRRRGADGEAHDRPHGPRGWHFGEANNRQQHGAGADDQREEGPRHGPGHGRGHVGGRRHHGFVRFIVSLLSGEHGDLRRCAYAGQHFVAHLTTLLQCGDCLSELTQQIGDSPFMQAHPRKAQRFQTLAHLLGVSTLDEINVPEVEPTGGARWAGGCWRHAPSRPALSLPMSRPLPWSRRSRPACLTSSLPSRSTSASTTRLALPRTSPSSRPSGRSWTPKTNTSPTTPSPMMIRMARMATITGSTTPVAARSGRAIRSTAFRRPGGLPSLWWLACLSPSSPGFLSPSCTVPSAPLSPSTRPRLRSTSGPSCAGLTSTMVLLPLSPLPSANPSTCWPVCRLPFPKTGRD
ncbi:hypothetical protein CAOG_009634 [Capsaspora owczarzaki ATCC 30864]|uniref:Uncharacterized protein n=1 Tax=Capsaspora owczarzaki (strain ATCC 30864) TaxID=595528 RepID=A0A0D2X284_CAPO3|nr:hypothetical protein CAOG_009634 [Capsaspora owczarzaki ATCC 30864]